MKAEAINAPAATSEGNPNPPVTSNKYPAMLGPTIWPRPNAAVILRQHRPRISGCELARAGQPQSGQTHEGAAQQRRGEHDTRHASARARWLPRRSPRPRRLD